MFKIKCRLDLLLCYFGLILVLASCGGKKYGPQIEIQPSSCLSFRSAAPPQGVFYFVGTGCDSFSTKKERCQLEAQNSAKRQMANSIDQTVSVYCEQKNRSKSDSSGQTYAITTSLCDSTFSSKAIDLSSIVIRMEECLETKIRGDPGYEAEVYRVHIRFVVPVNK
jgi:hypothetical protein